MSGRVRSNGRTMRAPGKKWLWGGWILLILALVSAGCAPIQQPVASMPSPATTMSLPAANTPASPANAVYPAEVTVTQAASKRDQGAFILDVREPSEWTDGHIPGSTLIPLGELPSRLNEVPRDREVVVVCRSGNRSAAGRDILKKAGFEQVTSMQGGLTAWKAAGRPTTSGQ